MSKVKSGDTVTVHYKGTLADGTVFDSSEGSDPLQFVVGAGQVIAGFNDAVVGLEVDEAKTVTISEEQAYGPKRDELIMQVPAGELPDEIDPQTGMQLAMRAPNGEAFPVTITEVSDEEVTIDGNHPLAGQDLTFEITVNAISAGDADDSAESNEAKPE